MELSIEVNRAVEELRRRTPKHEVFEVLEQYRRQPTIRTYYMALDLLGHRLGIRGAALGYGDEGSYHVEGYAACVDFIRGNPLNGEERVMSYRRFPDTEQGFMDCYVYAAKKQVKQLMKVQNLKSHVFGNGEG